jgi:hypothetical protein
MGWEAAAISNRRRNLDRHLAGIRQASKMPALQSKAVHLSTNIPSIRPLDAEEHPQIFGNQSLYQVKSVKTTSNDGATQV